MQGGVITSFSFSRDIYHGLKTGADLGLDRGGLGELRTTYECHQFLLKPKVSEGHAWLGKGEACHLEEQEQQAQGRQVVSLPCDSGGSGSYLDAKFGPQFCYLT